MELLDVYDDTNTVHLGVKSRAEVHRDGDWHRCFHLWVVSGEGLLLQRRAHDKDAFPGRLDATAAGHLSAGESIADGIREVREELGVTYPLDTLTDLGVHRVDDRPAPGMVNREHQYVFAVRDDRRLEEWTAFDRGEVAGLVWLRDLGALLEGRDVPGEEWDGHDVRPVTVTPAELVPAPYLRVLTTARI